MTIPKNITLKSLKRATIGVEMIETPMQIKSGVEPTDGGVGGGDAQLLRVVST